MISGKKTIVFKMHRSKRTLKNAAGAALPAGSTILKAVLAETANPHQNAGNLASMILNDMGLTIYLFRLINSAFYSSSRSGIISMRYVVVLLGIDNVARALRKIPVIPAKKDANLWLLRFISSRAVLASHFALAVSEKLSLRFLEPEEARVCTMMRPFGLLSLWCAYPDQFAAIYDSATRTISIERYKRISGWSPPGLGYELARLWNLPRAIRIVICPGQFNLKRISRREALLLSIAVWSSDYVDGSHQTGSKAWLKQIRSRLEEDLGLPWKTFSKMVPGVLDRFQKELPEDFALLREEGIIEMLPV